MPLLPQSWLPLVNTVILILVFVWLQVRSPRWTGIVIAETVAGNKAQIEVIRGNQVGLTLKVEEMSREVNADIENMVREVHALTVAVAESTRFERRMASLEVRADESERRIEEMLAAVTAVESGLDDTEQTVEELKARLLLKGEE